MFKDALDHQSLALILFERRKTDIAVIGLSGRFAGSPNLDAFWSHLQKGQSCIKPIRRKGWEQHSNLDPTRVLPSQVKWGGMLEHIDRFDPLFFNISPLEATRMDPQQRLFLEEAYKAFEDAGYSVEQLSDKSVGVFVGARAGDYQEQILRDGARRLSEIDSHLFLGNDMAILAARISYFLNLKGPSLTIDTASSSSLVAIHLACESIRTGESEMALAGGVFIINSPEYYLMAAKTQMLSSDGKCKTFDKSANGIVIGEGVGALVLKPLDAAIEDGDHIYGVIKGSAINQDGKTLGITAPSLLSQKALLVSLYTKAAIHPETLSYIEAHGTGSKIGDPIEVQALIESFRTFTEKTQYCAIGSHKPNIGHTIATSGMAGVFKVLLAMKYRQIPPTINVEEVNPQIDFQSSPFFLNTELIEWKSPDGKPRRAGVSSFGLSGTNCHLILEESPTQELIAHEQARPAFFFPFSARTKAALAQRMEDMIHWLENEGEKHPVEDLSYTLIQGRSHFAVRSAVVARDAYELLDALRVFVSNGGLRHDVEDEQATPKHWEPAFGHELLQALRDKVSFAPEEYKEKLLVLADLYMQGVCLDWGQLFAKGSCRRVPLPTYPFLGESYWIETTEEADQTGTNRGAVGRDRTGASSIQLVPLLGKRQPAPVPTDKLQEVLSRLVSDLLRVRVEDIDPETPLSEYGFDSITFTELAGHLSRTYDLNVTPPLFYEHSTIERLAQHLQTTSSSVLVNHFAGTAPHRERDLTPERQAHAMASSIAIIGMSGVFPQAPDVESLWNNLLAGRDCIGEIPSSRWDWQTSCDVSGSSANQMNVKWAGIVEEVELFDPLFFGISPREAEQMDPQQRLLMMYVWKAIEDAGYAAESLSGTNTALFVGTISSGYCERLFQAGVTIEGYSSTSQVPSVGPGRMSYFLNLHGPSEAIETACSSSLVAIHRGVNAIERGECSMAIVGGVNTLVSPELHMSFCKAGMLSPDGRCKAFSAQANGYARSEGVGMLVLKSLVQAERDGDHIYGVILGSAENHGGHANSLTTPNPRAQADVLIAAYRKAGIDPRTIGYIEAHGTGTALGDPIEINGLKVAFSELAETGGMGPTREAWCGIGSVKSHIGHLEWAAGVVGVIKVLLQMQHKKLVKSLHSEQINPYIELKGSPFYIVQETRDWEALHDNTGKVLPRRAGVSSFGFGGVNTHVVLEEYVPGPQAPHQVSSIAPGAIIVLSARDEERLNAQVRQLLAWVQAGMFTEEHLGQGQDLSEARSLQNLAYTLQVGRSSMVERLALQVSSFAELKEKLRRYLQEPQEGDDWYRGQAKQYKEMVALFRDDEELQEAIDKWLKRGKYKKLLQGWVKGITIDWKRLYTVGARSMQSTEASSCPGSAQGTIPTVAPTLPRRISLPTYPFARERYWLPTPQVELTQSQRAAVTSLRGGVSPRSSNASPFSISRSITLRPLQEPHTPAEPSIGSKHRTAQGQALSASPAPSELEEELVRSLAHVLGIEESDINGKTPFKEIGLDSITGVEWIQALNKQYSLSLSATKVYDYPTLHAFADFLTKKGGVSPARVHPQEFTPGREAEVPSNPGRHVSARPEEPVSRVPLQEEARRGNGSERNSVVTIDEIEQGIVQVTMQDRVHKNMFSTELIDGLIKAFQAIEESRSAKVVILTGYDSYFAMGGTKEGLLAIQEGKHRFTDANIYSLALDCKLPVIAAMGGHAFGAGWSLGLFCDFVVMSRESSYASNYITYGFTPGAGATLIFPEKLGRSLAQEVLYTGKALRGSDLEAKGVAFTVCTRKEVLLRARELARELAQAPREALIGLKELLAQSIRERVSATYEREVRMHERTFVNQPEVKARIEARFGRIGTNVSDKETQNAIAIIGMSGKYPAASNLSTYWENLVQGKNGIREVPLSRWDAANYYDPSPGRPGKMYCKWLGALDEIEYFDPLFFHLSPADAEAMHPQGRIFLEEGYRAFEDAGYSPGLLSNSKCGVYLGIISLEYDLLLHKRSAAGKSLLGGSSAIAAARIAYHLNLKGPALAIDTACSSSLVAVHLACQALRDREIDMALVGGVSLYLTPDFYIGLCSAEMLSPDGQCKTFDASANGFVPGEGVGALVLKRLADAQADHDQIYGVIIGSGMNQDGATNGITAPSVKSQSELVSEIYEKYHIDPESISYVEMHGTGTKLGDPIELEALATVFQEKTQRKQYCAIGSVKTNIGHTSAAAGLAGLQKVLLQMKQKKLVPSLHFEQPNPHFDFAASPFYVNTCVQNWKSEAGTPLRAAVSSFGFSGTNAHLVVEEYIPAPSASWSGEDGFSPSRPLRSPGACLFVLSAKSESQLKSYAREMVLWVQAHPELALLDMAFTLQVGKQPMEYRLAMEADSREVLLQRLADFVDGHTSTGIHTGQIEHSLGVRPNTVQISPCGGPFDVDADGQSLLHSWYKKDLANIARVWVRGVNVDWSLLYTAGAGQVQADRPHRVSLPTYPFARERYRIPSGASPLATAEVKLKGERRDVSSHPLLGQHWTSAVHSDTHFWDMSLSTDLFPYLNDHRVQGATVLPAAAYAEMALAAAKEVFAILPILKDITFKKALFLSEVEDKRVQLILTLEHPGVATFRFFSQETSSGTGQPTWTLHASGTATTDLSAGPLCASECETPEQIQARCPQVYTRQEYYQSLALRGLEYGLCFQALAAIERRDGEALGRIQLAEQVIADSGAYLVHPALLDGCFQVLFAALPTHIGETDTYVPVRLKGLQISDHLGQQVWSHVVLRSGNDEKTDVIEGDVFLIDAQGRVVLAAVGLVGQRLTYAREQQHLRDWLYEWRWEARSWAQIDRSLQKLPHGQWLLFADRSGISKQLQQLLTASGRDCVLAFKGTSYQQLTPQSYLLRPGSSQDVQQLLKDASSASHPFCGIIHLWSVDSHPATAKTATSIEAAQEAGVLSVMHLVQAIASLGGDRPPLLWLVTCGAQPVDQANHALSVEQAPVSGLGRVLVNEHPELECRRIDLERTDVSEQAQLLFWELQVGDREDEVALSKGARLVHRLVRCETVMIENKQPLFRPDATYLITGGLGGLGLTIADWMVRQGARFLVLVGRSGTSLEADQVITTLQEMGAQIVAAKADISEEQQVADLLTTIHTSLPPLRGLIHAAAVLDDGVLLQQDTQRFRKVMAPKIKGTWNLHTLTAHLDLDFFVLFSSAATLLGLPGQSNYVASNEFLDVLAHYRRGLGLPGLSINWGTWSEVGMAARSHSGERLALRGMSSIAPQQGLDALGYLLSLDRPQVAVMSVDWPQWLLFSPEFADSPLLTHLTAQSQAMTHAIVQATQRTFQAPILATRPEEHLELVTRYLSEQIDQALGLAANRNLPLIKQGLDSLMAIELKNRIQAGLGVSVSVTQLLENASTTQLAQEVFEQLQAALTHQRTAKPRTNGPLPLSFAQQRLWLLDKMFPGSTNYNIPLIVRATGPLNIQALQQSLQEIVRRHEVLRTTFDVVEGQPVQVIASEVAFSLPLVDLCEYRFEEREQAAMRLATEEAQLSFDLTRGPLLRAQLLYLLPYPQTDRRNAENLMSPPAQASVGDSTLTMPNMSSDFAPGSSQYWLLITVHHIVFDVWSFGVLLRELGALYSAHVQRQPSPLLDLPLQYRDYTLWQHEQMQSKLLDNQLAYWKERLAGAPLVLELPTDHPRPAVQSYRGARYFFRISPVLMERVADLRRREGVTLFMTLLAAWQIVLGHTSQQKDFLVGVPIAGRQRREIEGLIGCFVNTLVLRAELADHLTFRDLLKQVKETTLAAYEHQDVPFEQLVEVLHPQRDLSRSPVFQVMFAMQNMPLPSLELPGLSATASEGPCTTSRFDVYINVWEKADFDHWIEYPTDLFEEGTIARMVKHYQQVLEQVGVNADLPIAHISLLTEQERQQVISDWNATQVDYSRPGWMHLWISEQAQRTPDAKALFFEQETMTYRQLEERSNQLGHYLQRLGVGPEQRVGVYLERSFSLVLALLSVLKAGGAYIPLDTSYPLARLEYMLKDGQVSMLLTQVTLRDRLSGFEGHEIVLDETWEVISQESEAVVSSQVSGQNLAYVIYTSGSTGRPKGVMNTHEGLANCLNWMQDTFGLTAADRVLQQTPTSFDVSVWEIFWPLIAGAGLVLARPGGQQDARYIQDLIVSAEVTTVHFVPSMLQNYLQMQESYPIPKHNLQRIICIGEALSSATVARSEQQWAVPIFNLYGPTEATIQVTWWPCAQQGEEQQTVPIGHPLANTQIYLLDQYGEPVPVGVAGELYIGGVQVTRGYLHRPDLTAERFVPDPWSSEPGGRLYKTGDLARHREDGVIEFLGRLDQQVKLRGYRIELGEIEVSLAQQAEVDEAVVMVREEGEQKLVAYLRGTGQVAASELRKWLRERVPEYMVPSAFVWVQHWPLTPNGKIDRRALPAPDQLPSKLDKTFVAPRTSLEGKLVEIWTDLLGLKQVGIHESFFDVGGHSLLATQLVTRVYASFHIEVSLRELLQATTIASMASLLEQRIPMQDESAAGQPQGIAPQAHSGEQRNIDQLLTDLESLSDDEVLTQLEKMGSEKVLATKEYRPHE